MHRYPDAPSSSSLLLLQITEKQRPSVPTSSTSCCCCCSRLTMKMMTITQSTNQSVTDIQTR
eukprot:TRINITY_DN3681_c0_g1_i1.p3 TRINITY_DN3681_c0_g1~~TRINITY_DN3681_c0_g1_i1.p3  ORF type:complete len:62 (+),score=14.19 TRINITY_DN3681_c0_g1_i1:228-413(+)